MSVPVKKETGTGTSLACVDWEIWIQILKSGFRICNRTRNPKTNFNAWGLYFSKTLFEGLIFGGAYLCREICVSKSIGLALYLEGHLPYLLYFTLYLRAISKYRPLRGLCLEGRFNGGFFALRVSGTSTWRGLFSEFYGKYVFGVVGWNPSGGDRGGLETRVASAIFGS